MRFIETLIMLKDCWKVDNMLKKRIGLIFLMTTLLFVSGCDNKNIPNLENTSVNTEIVSENNEGVYYEPLNENEVTKSVDPLASNMCGVLLLNHRIYHSVYTESFDSGAENKSLISDKLDAEISDVYVNAGVYFSDDHDKLLKITGKGKAYSIVGYASDFRVMVEYETVIGISDQKVINYQLFESLNDVVLKKGSEILNDRYHLNKDEIRLQKLDAEYNMISAMPTSEKASIYDLIINADFIKTPIVDNQTDLSYYCFIDLFGIRIYVVLYGNEYIRLSFSDGTTMFLRQNK